MSNETLGNKIKQARIANNLSQRKLAKLCHTT